MRKMKALLKRHRELFAYVAAGILTIAVNYVTYSVLTVLFRLGITLSNTIAWAVSVLTAFLTNKTFVFQKGDWSPPVVLREGAMFVSSRLLSGAVAIGLVPVLMRLGVTQSVLGIPGFAAKMIAETIGLIMNYFCGKFVVFK